MKPTAAATPTQAQIDAEVERILALTDTEVMAEFEAECAREGTDPAEVLKKMRAETELTLAACGFGRG